MLIRKICCAYVLYSMVRVYTRVYTRRLFVLACVKERLAVVKAILCDAASCDAALCDAEHGVGHLSLIHI